MNKKLILITYIMLIFIGKNSASTIVSVRDLFYRASKSSKSTDSLVNLLFKEISFSSPEIMGYKGMAKLMVCYHSYNPYIKLSYFYEGKALLEKAIKLYPKNLELRFLRLSVQLNAPSILMYNSNIKEDKIAIFENIKYVEDKDLLIRIFNFTINAKKISPEEKNLMKAALKENKKFSIT